MYRIGNQNFSSLSAVRRVPSQHQLLGWSVSIGPAKFSNDGVSWDKEKTSRALAFIASGGASEILIAADPRAEALIKKGADAGWDMTKRIVNYGENIANIPAGMINAGVKKITPDSWDAYMDMAFPKTPVNIPTNYTEFVAEYQRQAPIVTGVLASLGPYGMAAGAAIAVIGVAMQGGSLEDMAWAAAEGATPLYIRIAAAAARGALKGGSAKDVLINAVADAGSAIIDNPAADIAIDIAKELIKTGNFLKGGSVMDKAISLAKSTLVSRMKSEGIDSQLQALATMAFDVIVNGAKAIVGGKDTKAFALSAALDAGRLAFAGNADLAAGYDVAAKILKGDNPKDLVIAEARAKLRGSQFAAFDKAVDIANTIRGGGSVNVALDAGSTAFKKGSAPAIGFDAAKALIASGQFNESTVAVAKAKLKSEAERLGFDAAVGMIVRQSRGTPTGAPSSLVTAGKLPLPSIVFFKTWAETKCKSSTVSDCEKLWKSAGAAQDPKCRSKKTIADYTSCMKSVAMPTQVLATSYAQLQCKKETGQAHGRCMDANYAIAEKYSKICAVKVDPTKCVQDNVTTKAMAETKIKMASVIEETSVQYNKMLWLLVLGGAAVVGGTFYILRK